MAMQLILQAWKGMLDGDSFIKAGWVHNLRLYQFSSADDLHMHGWVGRRSLIVIPLYILFLFIYAYIDLGKLAPISQQFYHAW